MMNGKCIFSSVVALVLLNFRKHPVEFSRSDLAIAVFADAGRTDLQRRTAIRTIKIGADRRRLGFAVTHERPVFAPTPQLFV